MLKIRQMEFSLFGVNTYIALDEATKQAAVIDPAMADAEEQKRFDDYITQSGAQVTQIINTHLHLDHCFGENYVKDKYGVPVKANVADAPLGENMLMQYAKFGMRNAAAKDVEIDVELKDGEVIDIGESKLYVIATPGHTPGGICLYAPDIKVLIAGDTLFRASIGRTDLPGGNHSQLIGSIKKKLYTLPDDVTVLPGHGEPTTIGWEKRNNPFTL